MKLRLWNISDFENKSRALPLHFSCRTLGCYPAWLFHPSPNTDGSLTAAPSYTVRNTSTHGARLCGLLKRKSRSRCCLQRKRSRGCRAWEWASVGKALLSHEGLNVDLQGRAGHGELELGDDVGVQHSQLPHALTSGKDLSAAPREESGACEESERKINISLGQGSQ